MQKRTVGILSVAAVLAAGAAGAGEVIVRDFDAIKLYTLKNGAGVEVDITNFGAAVTAIRVPDRDGNLGDVALGYDSVEGYINAVDKPYFGSVVGRYGNRIAGGRWESATSARPAPARTAPASTWPASRSDSVAPPGRLRSVRVSTP